MTFNDTVALLIDGCLTGVDETQTLLGPTAEAADCALLGGFIESRGVKTRPYTFKWEYIRTL